MSTEKTEVDFWDLLANEGSGVPVVEEELYVPPASFGDEHIVVFAAAMADVSLLMWRRHVAIPLSWARRQYPDNPWIEVFDRSKRRREGEAGGDEIGHLPRPPF